MRLKKIECVMALSFVSGVIFLFLFIIDRKSYFFYLCLTLLAISIISVFVDTIMQKVQKRKKIEEDCKECEWALKCSIYCAEDPCEKPSCRFMRRPVCFMPNKTGLMSKLFGKIAEGLLHIGGLED